MAHKVLEHRGLNVRCDVSRTMLAFRTQHRKDLAIQKHKHKTNVFELPYVSPLMICFGAGCSIDHKYLRSQPPLTHCVFILNQRTRKALYCTTQRTTWFLCGNGLNTNLHITVTVHIFCMFSFYPAACENVYRFSFVLV